MKKQTSFLISTLILLTAFSALTGCRTNGAPLYKVTSWEFYNPFSKASKKDNTIDDYALANDIEDSSRSNLPKTEVAVPRDGYLNGSNPARETRVAKAAPASTRVDTFDAPKNYSTQPSTVFAGNNNINPANSADPLAGTMPGNMTALNNTPNSAIPSYGSTTPIGANNPQQAGNSFAANQLQNGQFNTVQQGVAPDRMNPAGMSNAPNTMYAGNVATSPANPYHGYNPSAAGASNPHTANPNGTVFAQHPTLETAGYPTGNGYDPNQTIPGLGTPAGASPNAIASNNGAGYVGDISAGNSLNNYNPAATGTTQPNAVQNPNQPLLYPNNTPGSAMPNAGNYDIPTNSAVGNSNAMNMNYQNPQTQPQVYNSGFQPFFAPAGDDSYRPGGY
ncbi:MAG: hypothetical protein LBT05_12720 [Planctomycetaceae bacterium]|jgi:hypothetical protein|nr:hypothetical protein [Planctomycetaceae bacterium]